MPSFAPNLPLRTLILVDAATCAAMGGVLLLASDPLGTLTAIPPALLFYAGLSLVPIAAVMAAIGSRPVTPLPGAAIVVAGNVLWVAASLLLLVGNFIAPNPLSLAFVLGQALVVALLAKLEFDAMRPARLQANAN